MKKMKFVVRKQKLGERLHIAIVNGDGDLYTASPVYAVQGKDDQFGAVATDIFSTLQSLQWMYGKDVEIKFDMQYQG